MSAISSFVLDCARSGRWLRGLMALQGQQASSEPAIRAACAALAQVAAPHSWAAALSLLHVTDALQHPQEVCRTVDQVARHAELPVDVFEAYTTALLQALRSPPSDNGMLAPVPSSASVQRRLFLDATRWCGWETAARLLACLPTPPPRACVERVQMLLTLRHRIVTDVGPFHHWGDVRESSTFAAAVPPPPPPLVSPEGTSLTEQLAKLELSTTRRYSARDRRELSRLRDMRRRELLQCSQAEEEAEATLSQQAAAAADGLPSVWGVCAALRMATRPISTSTSTAARCVLWPDVLAQAEAHRLTPDIAVLYARAAGLLTPHSWRATVERLGRAEVRDARLHRQLTMWVVSRGCWSAALERLAGLHHDASDGASAGKLRSTRDSSLRADEKGTALDCVLRTAAPASRVLGIVPQTSRPWYRLTPSLSTTVSMPRQIAAALARGVRLDEVQMSEAGKEWAAQGRWEAALALYLRLPLPEFQKYAVRSLVTARPALPPTASPASSSSSSESWTSVRSRTRRLRDRGSQSDSTSGGAAAAAAACFDVLAAVELLVPQDGIRLDSASPPRPAPPLGTFPACLLVDAAGDWAEALAVFRACVRRGTRCNPQLLSALLRHRGVPPQELRQLLRSYPAAVNDGVRRRASEVLLGPL
ncbi:hypothetical protein NESM_000071000 [Novymonas esmeraldas]|uniref:Uncharacterized protein n=1 Tax=Novymonas esmeraldas TaxID=1808958 RepID=A0AAW0F1G4_9TRYP